MPKFPEIKVPEFNIPSRYRHALTNQIETGQLIVDTRRGWSGWYETKVLDGGRLLYYRKNSVWCKAQVDHRMALHAWQCAQQWTCTVCYTTQWALPGEDVQCCHPECPGGEMCALCTPLQKCDMHHG